MKFGSGLLFALLSVATLGSAQAATFRTVADDNTLFSNGSWSFGTIFTVGANDVNVSSLGAFDAGHDGFMSDSIKVGIFDESSQALLTFANVVSSDTLVGDYRYSAISNLTLTSGHQYRLVAVSGSDLYSFPGTSYDTSAFTINGFGYSSSTELTTRVSHTEGDYGMGNFQYNVAAVPEPETYAMLLAGLGLLGGVARRKQKQ